MLAEVALSSKGGLLLLRQALARLSADPRAGPGQARSTKITRPVQIHHRSRRPPQPQCRAPELLFTP